MEITPDPNHILIPSMTNTSAVNHLFDELLIAQALLSQGEELIHLSNKIMIGH